MLLSGHGSTPPHHPTHNVHFSPGTIQAIVSTACPGQNVLNIESLPSGKSFNNRIYFVDVTPPTHHALDKLDRDAGEGAQKQGLVLKVSGQFFGPDKAQNEVSCLLLLEKHCPDVPAPRVIAWSEDGVSIRRSSWSTRPQTQKPASVRDYSRAAGTDTCGRGWVMMTRQPGRVIDVEDLRGPHGASLMRELAGHMAQWRQKMPKADRIGNIKHVGDGSRVRQDDIYESLEDHSLQVTIEGLLLCHYIPTEPIISSSDYYRIKLEDQLTKLDSEDVFSATRSEVSPLIRYFIKNALPELTLFSSDQPTAITFTHYDFSPRNILVSESSPPSITGILDFEFGGFFPHEEEFTNNAIANANDWLEPAYKVFLEELERLQVRTPLRGIDGRSWREACRLVQITEDVAPWNLREGGIKGLELEAELRTAAERIKREISDFNFIS